MSVRSSARIFPPPSLCTPIIPAIPAIPVIPVYPVNTHTPLRSVTPVTSVTHVTQIMTNHGKGLYLNNISLDKLRYIEDN